MRARSRRLRGVSSIQRQYGTDAVTAPLPDLTDPAVWPHQVTVFNQLCMDVYSFVDVAPVLANYNLTSFPFYAPAMYVILTEPQSNVKFNALNRSASFGRGDYGSVIDEPVPILVEYEKLHVHTFAVTKLIGVDGAESLSYKVDQRNERSSTPEQILQRRAFLYAARPGLQPQAEAWLAEPGVQLFTVRWCLSPSSLSAQVTVLKNQYGILAFFSDLGGFLNLCALVLAILFPLALRSEAPRKFVAFWLINRMNRSAPGDEHFTKYRPSEWTSADAHTQQQQHATTRHAEMKPLDDAGPDRSQL